MRKLLIITFISFIGLSVKAQTNLDSLWGVWNDKTLPDTTRLEAISQIAWYGYLFSQPDSAFYFAQMQYDFADNKGLKKEMAIALNTQGVSFALRGEYSKALEHHQRSLKIYEEIDDKRKIAEALNYIGIMYRDQGDYPKALEHYQRSLKIKEEIGDKEGIAVALDHIGTVFLRESDYIKALEYYQRSLKIREEIGDEEGTANSLLNIGIIYYYQGDYPKALEYSQRSLKIYEKIGDKRKIAMAVSNIGANYAVLGDDPKALKYYQRSLKIKEEINDKNGIANSLNNIGLMFQEQGDYPKGLEHYQRSLKIREEIGDKSGIAMAVTNIGGLYQKQGDHQQAIKHCGKGLLLAQEIGTLVYEKEACNCLYDAHKSLGNGNKALEYHEQMLALDDSLNAKETAKKLQQMEFQKVMLADSIAKAEEARVIKELHQEEVRKKNNTRNMLIVGGLIVLLIAGGIYSRLRYTRKAKAVIEKEKDRSENLLLNILPADIAAELKEKGKAEARDFDLVTIIFTDFKGFTQQSAKLSAAELVSEINHCFEAFDHIIEKHGVEKIKTIGDAYMAAGGLPVPSEDSIKNTVLAALEMQEFIVKRKEKMDLEGQPAFEMRVGIHTGPVVAGIVGVKKFQYDIWGDTVNTASRIESNGQVGKVNVSEATYELLKTSSEFTFENRGKIEAKGKGEIEMYFVSKN
jgi:class 3 adenylate cyclase